MDDPAAAASGMLPPLAILRAAECAHLFASLASDKLVCSPIQLIAACTAEGTSTIARDLAVHAASTLRARTLLLDLDPLVQRQATWFEHRYHPDAGATPTSLVARGQNARMSDFDRLSHAMAFRSFGGDRLTINTRHTPPLPEPSYWRVVLRILETRFDLIVVDSPSIQSSQAGLLLSPFMAANIIVVRAEMTPTATVISLRDRIFGAGGRVSGCILNRQRLHLPAILERPIA